MNFITKLVVKSVGKCIDAGHEMKFADYQFYFRGGDGRVRYNLIYNCRECGYTKTRESTIVEEAAIKVLNDAENKND